MMRIAIVAALTWMTIGLVACGDSGSTAPPTTSTSASQRIADDLRASGQQIKSAATEAATQVGPALERAKEEGRDAVHNVAQKIADRTATAPASQQ